MRRLMKTIAVILCLIMAVGNFAFADEAKLISAETKDYEGHWAQTTIQKWIDEGRASGYPDGSYKPDNNVTRAEFVKMVNGIIDFAGKGNASYTDVPATEWYYDYIGIAQEIGYISGYPGGQFGPNDYITREQAASILARIQYLDSSATGVDKFSDKSSISSWAAEAVGAASEAGFISGYNDGSFRPSKNLTRAEAVTMLENVMNNAKNHIIYNAGTKIENFVFDGDLVIAETVGEGDVTLNNVTVNGVLKVLGGGENSLYFNNVKVDRVVVSKEGVRLVLGQGTEIQEVELTSETILENTDGSIAKIVVNSNGTVTLKGKFDEVEVNAEADIVLNNATITKLVAEKPIVIKGTGTITTLEANADNIKFESKVDVKKTVVGEGVKTPPAKQEDTPSGGSGGGGGTPGGSTPKEYKFNFNLKLEKNGKQVSNIPFVPITTFKDTEIVSNIAKNLIPEVEKLLNNTDVKKEVEKLLAIYNDKIEGADTIKVGGRVIYTKDGGWNENAYLYLEGTDIKAYLDAEYPDLLGKTNLELDDIIKLLSVYKAVYGDSAKVESDLNKIKTTLEAEFNEDSTQAITFTYGGTEKKFNMYFDSKVDYNDIDLISELVDFINANYTNSYKTLSNFVNTYGNSITVTTTTGDITGTFTVTITEK